MKKNFLKVTLFGILFNLALAGSFCQNDKNTVYIKSVEKFKSLNTISVNFSVREGKSEIMTIKASRGNKYSLEIPDRKIVSNGKTIWNISLEDNTVVISNYEPSEAGVSVEQIFFDILSVYQPKELKKETTSFDVPVYNLILAPEKSEKIINDIESINLFISQKNYKIKSIFVKTASGEIAWTINKIITNPKLPESTFEFTPPMDVKVIDLR